MNSSGYLAVIKFFLSLMVLMMSVVPVGYALDKPLDNFIELHQVAPSIMYDIRYASSDNFVGRPISGYQAPKCYLTKAAALALKQVQKKLLKSGLSLLVYDCYRPTQAVNDFWQWSQHSAQRKMKEIYYPRVKKEHLFRSGYIAKYSGHSRGSTVDLTIINDNSPKPKHPKVSCIAPYNKRNDYGKLDMGTSFDCMDVLSSGHSRQVSLIAYHNRQLLRAIMKSEGFRPYRKEWWHFTLKNEPYKHESFNFKVK